MSKLLQNNSQICVTHKFFSKSGIKNKPVQMGGITNWRKKLSNFWPVQLCPTPLDVGGTQIFTKQHNFSSIEQAFHWAKFHFTTQQLTVEQIIDIHSQYPSILLQHVNSNDIDDQHFLREIRPFMVKVKSCSGKGAMKKAGYSLDVDRWNDARVQVTIHLLQTRLNVDIEFQHILRASLTSYLLHTDRAGQKSFWGGSDKGGKNILGELLMQLRTELLNTNTL